MAAELAIIAKLQDEASSGIRALRGEIEGIEPSAGMAAKGFATLQTVGAAALTALAAAAVAVGSAIVSSIGVAADFEDQIAILSTAAQGAGTSLDTLRDAALAVGSDTALVGVSASQAADAMTLLYKAGLTTGEIFGDLNGYLAGSVELSGALRAAVDGAAASELDMAQAADLAATTLATFGGHLTTSAERAEFVNVALNNFVQAADASNASVGDLAAAMANIGPTAAQFGFSLQDTNTALALLSTRGISGAEAGTALKSMFTNLMRPTDDVRNALAELNVSLYNADGTMRSMPAIVGDLSQALYGMNEVTTIVGGRTAEQNHQLELAQAAYNQATDAIYKHNAGLKVLTDAQLGKYVEQQAAANAEIQRLTAVTGTASTAIREMTDEQRNQYIQTLAGSYGMKAMAVLLMEGTAGWEAMEKAIASAATIQEVAAARTATFSGAMEALSGVIETIRIGIGSAFLPVLTALARALAELASQHMQQIVDAFEAVGQALSSFFDAILRGVSPITALADAIGGLAEAFGLPAAQAEALRDNLEGFLQAVSNLVRPVWEAISSFFSWKDILILLGGAIMAVVIPALVGVVQFLSPILAVVAALMVAVAALRNAWENDFLGIRSAVESAVDVFFRFAEAIAVFTDLRSSLSDMVSSLDGLPGPLAALAAGIGTFLREMEGGAGIVEAFQTGLATFSTYILNWAGAENWSELGGIILGKIADGFRDLGSRAADTAANILNWISTSVNSIDWHAVGNAIVTGIAAAITAAVGLFVTAGTAISNFFGGFFTSENLKEAGTNFVTSLSNAISGVASGIETGLASIKTAIMNWVGVTEWSDVGGAILDKIAETFRNLGNNVAEASANILNWISNAVSSIDWRAVGEAIINGIVNAITAVVGLLAAAGTAIVNYFIGFFTNDEIGPAGENFVSSLSNAISEFAGGISDGLEALEQKIFEWADAEDWSGVGETITTRVGEAMAEARDRIGEKLAEWQQAIFDWADAEDWAGVAEHIAEQVGEAMVDAAGKVSERLGEWQQAIFDWADAEDWAGVAEHIAEKVGEAMVEAAGKVSEKLGEWQQAIFDWADAEDWTGVATHIAEKVAEALASTGQTLAENLESWQQAIFDWAGEEDWSGVATKIAEMVRDGLGEKGDTTAENLGSWQQAIYDWAGEEDWEGVSTVIAEAVGTSLSESSEIISSKLSTWITAITDWVGKQDWKQIGYDIMFNITDAWLEFKEKVTTKVSAWYTDLRGMLEKYTWQEIGLYILSKIIDALTGKGEGGGGAEGGLSWNNVVTTWYNELKAAIATMGANFRQLGADIVAGIVAGIEAARNLIAGAMAGVADATAQHGRARFQSESPSRLMMPIGYDVSAGIAVGILQGAGTIMDSIGQLASQVQVEGAKAFGEAMKELAEGLAAGMNAILDLSAFPGVGGSFLDNLRSVVDMLIQMVAEVNRANTYGAEALSLLGDFVGVAADIADLMSPLIVALVDISQFPDVNVEQFTSSMARIAAFLQVVVGNLAAANQYSVIVLEGLSHLLEVVEQIAATIGPFISALYDINAFGDVDLWFFHEGIAQLWYTMLLVVQKVQQLAVLGEQTLERMSGFLDIMETLADIIGPLIASLYELNAFGNVDLWFFHEGIEQLAYVMLVVVQAMAEANHFGFLMLQSIREFAETAGAIAEMIGPMIEGLLQINALDGTMNEVAYHAVYFRNGVRALVDALASAAILFTTGVLQHVQQFAETAGAIAEIIVPAVEGLMVIATLTGELNYLGLQATYFRNALRTVVSAIESAAVLFTAAVLNQVQLFAETAGKIMELIVPAVEGFAVIATLTGELNYIGLQATYFRNGLRTIVSAIESAAVLFTAATLNQVKLFAETAGAIVELVADAIDALRLLAGYVAQAGLEAAAHTFASDLTTVIVTIVNALRAAGLMANEAVNQAAELADGLGDVLAMVEDGVDALLALAGYTRASGFTVAVNQFAADLVQVLLTVVNALRDGGALSSSAVAAAGELSDSIGDIMGAIEDGVDGLMALATYISNAGLRASAEQFAADLAMVLLVVADALSRSGVLASAAVEAAAELSGDIEDLVKMIAEAVDALGGLSGYASIEGLVESTRQFAADLVVVLTTVIEALSEGGVLANIGVVQAGELGKGLKDLLGAIDEGVEALTGLSGYTSIQNMRVIAEQFGADLAATVMAVADGLAQAGVLTSQAVAAANAMADGLGSLMDVITEGLQVLADLGTFVGASGMGEKAQKFAADLAAVIMAVADGLSAAGVLASQAVAAAALMEASVTALLGIIGDGVDALEAVAEYATARDLRPKIDAFAADLVALTSALTAALSAAAGSISQEAMASAAQFAADAAALATAVDGALSAMGAIAAAEGLAGLNEKIAFFANTIVAATALLTSGLSTAAANIGQEAIASAAQFASSAAALLVAVNAALTALAAIAQNELAAGLGERILAFAQQLIATTTYLAQGLSTAAATLGETAMAAAVAFASNAAAILRAVDEALRVMTAIGENELTEGLAAKIQYFAQQLIAITTYLAQGLSAAALNLAGTVVASAIAFANNAAAIAQAVDAALKALVTIAGNELGGEMATRIQALGQQLIAISSALATSLAHAAAAIGPAIVQAATMFAASVTALAREVHSALTTLTQLAGMPMPNIQPVLTYIVTTADQIRTAFSAAGDIGQAVVYAANFRANLTQLVQEVQGAVAQLNALAGTGTAGSIGAALANIAQSLQNTQGQFAGAGAALANALIQALTAGVSSGGGAVSGALQNVLNTALSAGMNAAGGFGRVGDAIIGAVAGAIQSGQGQVIGALTQVINAAINAGIAAARGAAAIGNQLIQAAAGEINAGRGQLDGAGAAAGNAMIDGMVRAVTAGRSRLVQAIIATVNAAVAAARAALGIASPSKVAEAMFTNFMATASEAVRGMEAALSRTLFQTMTAASRAAAAGLYAPSLTPEAVAMPASVSTRLGGRAPVVGPRPRPAGAAGQPAGGSQVVIYGDLVLPGVADSRSFLEELDALRGGAR